MKAVLRRLGFLIFAVVFIGFGVLPVTFIWLFYGSDTAEAYMEKLTDVLDAASDWGE